MAVAVAPDGPPALFALPGGQQARVAVGPDVTEALWAAQPEVARALVVFDPAPPPPNPVLRDQLGGGRVAADPVLAPFDLKVQLQASDGSPVAPAEAVAGAAGGGTLPLGPPAEAGAAFRWLHEVVEDGVPLGYAWAPWAEVVDPDAGTVTITLPVAELQGTLFVPVSVTPGYVANHDLLVHLWSGPTREARDFGFAGPQFTTFAVAAPQAGLRLLVLSPVVRDYGWIDVEGVGPVDAPPEPA